MLEQTRQKGSPYNLTLSGVLDTYPVILNLTKGKHGYGRSYEYKKQYHEGE